MTFAELDRKAKNMKPAIDSLTFRGALVSSVFLISLAINFFTGIEITEEIQETTVNLLMNVGGGVLSLWSTWAVVWGTLRRKDINGIL